MLRQHVERLSRPALNLDTAEFALVVASHSATQQQVLPHVSAGTWHQPLGTLGTVRTLKHRAF